MRAGNSGDYKQASALVKDYQPLAALADKGYNADWLKNELQQTGVSEIMIPLKEKPKAATHLRQRTIQRQKRSGKGDQ